MFDPGLRQMNSELRSDLAGASAPHAHEHWASVNFTDLAPLLGAELPVGHDLTGVSFPVRRVKPGETLYRAGDKFSAIYVVRSGFLKTVSVDAGGAELVLGFPMGGDVIGLEGVDSGYYTADVVALDMSNVAVVPFARLAQLGRQHPCIERLLFSIFSRELVQKHRMFRLLGTLGAEARLSSFLLGLADRFGKLGYSRTSFTLRMTRQEIGSHLGIKLETVSRTLSAFAAAGLIEVDRRAITLSDVDGLRRIVEPQKQECVERPMTRNQRPRPRVKAAFSPLSLLSMAAA